MRALAVQADAADDAQMERALAEIGRAFPRLDLWVANAGVFRRTPLARASERDWDDMLRLNFETFLVPARRIGPRMQRQGAGCIVALADVAALRPWADYIPYCVAKRGVVALVRGSRASPRAAGARQRHRARTGPVPRRLPCRGAGARDRAHSTAPRRRSPRRHRRAVRYLATERLRDRHAAAGRRRPPACLKAPTRTVAAGRTAGARSSPTTGRWRSRSVPAAASSCSPARAPTRSATSSPSSTRCRATREISRSPRARRRRRTRASSLATRLPDRAASGRQRRRLPRAVSRPVVEAPPPEAPPVDAALRRRRCAAR